MAVSVTHEASEKGEGIIRKNGNKRRIKEGMGREERE